MIERRRQVSGQERSDQRGCTASNSKDAIEIGRDLGMARKMSRAEGRGGFMYLGWFEVTDLWRWRRVM